MTTGYICAACGETFTGDGRWLQSGYRGSIAPMQWWDLCPECPRMEGSAKWLDCHRESMREHSMESESVREQSESVRERRYESQDVTGSTGRVTESPELSHDTREKLEKDVRKHYAYSTTTLMYPPSANKTTDMLSALPVDTVIGWLDRQASITKKECADFWQEIAEDRDRAQVKCAELCDQVDELKAKLDAEAQHAREAWQLWGEADVKLERMTAERDQWKDAYEDSERMRFAMVVGEEIAGRL